MGPVTSCQNPLDNELNGTTAGAAFIPFNTNVTGLISPASDIDYYKFTITTGGRITISLNTLPADYNIRLRNSVGTQVAIAQRTGTRSESLNYTAAVGTYYIEVYGANAAANNAATCYTLRVALGTAARNDPPAATTGNIEINGTTSTLEEANGQRVELFPNPVLNNLHVLLHAVSGKTTIDIFDLNGKKVKTISTSSYSTLIDMFSLSKGIYLIRISNKDQVIHQAKIIKQ